MRRDFVNTMALTGARNISEVQKNGAKLRSS
jgi:L-lactate dehydrogenase (cytochrome)